MIHAFRFHEYYLILDVESGALHSVDEPAYAVVQVAYGWGEGSHAQPAAGPLARLWNAGTIVYRNDLDGTVLVTCDSIWPVSSATPYRLMR